MGFADKKIGCLSMRNFIILCVSAVIVVVLVVTLSVTLSTKDPEGVTPSLCGVGNHNCRGGWFYHSSYNDAEHNANYAKSKGWNFVFISMRTSIAAANIKAFHDKGISVHWMTLEGTQYVTDVDASKKKITEILDFLRDNNLTVEGIHLDAEPHALDEWKNGDDNTQISIIDKFLVVLEEVRKLVSNYSENCLLSSAIAYWFPNRANSGRFPNTHGYDFVNSKRLHMVAPMIYSGTGETAEVVIKNAQGYLNDKVPTVVGMGVLEYPNENALNENILLVFNEFQNDVNKSSYFYGVSIFANTKYTDWTD
ncbi:hypothetical protein GPJ56_009879 [Histomonas meleagridis]|uniref:uncharacterized protein n=1 Tax=Histomonas meleagridis TaxID=135588 RepID=UPI00355A7936|nr:hypothetical protein GPJ56_009879 [Histomonas meleagridis]KAH0802815.1 hypothetical protein GO595_004322 [Histomonas meleagridis]